MEGLKKTMNERNLNEGQWEDRKQWSLGVVFNLIYTYIQNLLPLVPTCDNSSGCPLSLPCQHSSMMVTVLFFFPDLQPSPYSTNRSPPLSYSTVLLRRPVTEHTGTFRDHMYTHLHTHTQSHTYMHTYIPIHFMYIHYIHMYIM